MTSCLPLVSVVVPTWNSASTIRACLESIRRQSYPRVEALVVDRGSTDGTREIASSTGAVVLVKGHERSAQRNAGACAARGDWVLFVDSDMVLRPDVVAACIRARGIGAAALIPEVGFSERFLPRVRAMEKSCYVGNETVEAPRFFPRSAFLALGGYDEGLSAGEDWDLTDRWRGSGRPVTRARSIIYHDDRALTLRQLLLKRYRYGRLYVAYLRKRPASAFGHLRPGRFLARGDVLRRDPLAAIGLLALKLLEASVFAFGLFAGLIGWDRPSDR